MEVKDIAEYEETDSRLARNTIAELHQRIDEAREYIEARETGELEVVLDKLLEILGSDKGEIIEEDKPFNKKVEEIYNSHIDYIYDKEDKKIERIGANNYKWNYKYDIKTPQAVVDNLELVRQKINEIIDYLEENK